ncbi:MAG: hypothetical protein ACP5QK_02560 [Myxococcota bacterium]
MEKSLGEFFERLKAEGIHSQYSQNNNKLYISASRLSDIEKIHLLLKRYRFRLSFIDSANSNIIFESKIDENTISINKKSLLLNVSSKYKINDAERLLNSEGLTLGYFFPPIFTKEEMTFSDWFDQYHIPALNYTIRDFGGNIRGIRGILPDGRIYESISAPRMATGSDINRLIMVTGRILFYPFEFTLKVMPLRNPVQILSFSSQKIKNLFLALSSIALKNVRIEFATLYTRGEGHNDPVLEIGYSKDDLYDFKNWIIRTVNNEGANLINNTSDLEAIKNRLNRFVEMDNQLEFITRYRGINRLEEILKELDQNYNIEGYLYRYERSSFSFRIILPQSNYKEIKDYLTIECKKCRDDIRLTDCRQNPSAEIPLSIYSRIVHSCN